MPVAGGAPVASMSVTPVMASEGVVRGSVQVPPDGQPIEHQPIAIPAVAQPLVDAADRRARRAGALADLVVAHALVQQASNRPPRGELTQLVHRAQVAQESKGLVGVGKRRDRLGEIARGVGHPTVFPGQIRARLGVHCFSTLKHHRNGVKSLRGNGH